MKNTKMNLTKLEHDIERILERPLHLRLEYFSRKPLVMLAVMALMTVAIAKSDGSFLDTMRNVYNHGYSKIGAYLRNETVHKPHVTAQARIVVAASK